MIKNMEAQQKATVGQEIDQLTAGMTQSAVIPNGIAEELNEYTELVQEVVRRTLSHKNSMFRVWIEGVVDNQKAELIRKDPPKEDESLEEWSQRVFKKKFGIIFNYSQEFSNELNQKILYLITPLLEKYGIPAYGLDMAVFVGNYSYTPLGIHRDLPGGKVLHLHMGPGPKHMYQWENEDYKPLGFDHPTPPSRVEPLIPLAEKFTFHAGDLFFMPENKWHIGKSEEFSVGISLWFNHYHKAEIQNKMLDNFKLTLRDKTQYVKPFQLSEEIGELEEFFSYQLVNELAELPFKDFLNVAYHNLKYELLSNGGFNRIPLKKEKRAISSEATIRTLAPFKILAIEDGQFMKVYVRGSAFKIFNNPLLLHIIDELNTHKQFVINELFAELYKEWDEDLILHFINQLYINNSIEVL